MKKHIQILMGLCIAFGSANKADALSFQIPTNYKLKDITVSYQNPGGTTLPSVTVQASDSNQQKESGQETGANYYRQYSTEAAAARSINMTKTTNILGTPIRALYNPRTGKINIRFNKTPAAVSTGMTTVPVTLKAE